MLLVTYYVTEEKKMGKEITRIDYRTGKPFTKLIYCHATASGCDNYDPDRNCVKCLTKGSSK